MKSRFSSIELICAIVFFICALLCLIWYILYAYFATPEIVLNGEKIKTVQLNGTYEEQGAFAKLDTKDITANIKIDNPVDTKKVGTYEVKYSVTNTKGRKKVTIKRIVKVRELEKPSIVLTKGTSIKTQYGSEYKDPGYKAKDNYDGDITDKVKIQGFVDTKQLGAYKLYYTVEDSSENSVTAVRTVEVVDTKAPKLTLKGKSHIQIKLREEYKDEGCTAIDNHDGDISNKVKVQGKVNTSIPGYYTLTYSVKDSFGNKAAITREVQVGTKKDIDDANHITISISEQRLWFYQDGVLQLTSSVVTGQKGESDTPRGSYRIQWKARDVYLRGPDYKTFVNYWMPIYGDIGMHDATWRSSFGGYIYQTAGSHGCINLPYYVAEKIYYNAPVGILVQVI